MKQTILIPFLLLTGILHGQEATDKPLDFAATKRTFDKVFKKSLRCFAVTSPQQGIVLNAPFALYGVCEKNAFVLARVHIRYTVRDELFAKEIGRWAFQDANGTGTWALPWIPFSFPAGSKNITLYMYTYGFAAGSDGILNSAVLCRYEWKVKPPPLPKLTIPEPKLRKPDTARKAIMIRKPDN